MKNCWFCYENSGNHDYHPGCARRFFGSDTVPYLQLDNNLLLQLAEQTINKRIAITGVQPKLSLTLEKAPGGTRLTVVGLWGEYILKPQHPGYPLMPETEDLTMHIASLFNLPTCKHTLLKASDGSMVYLAKRLDRDKGKKIHMEDLCQLSEFQTDNKYKSSYERVGKLIAKNCTNSGLDTLNYFELVLFSYLSGNNDMHLKNFSVRYTNTGIELCPAYDLLNVNLINPKDTEELALTINGKKSRINLSDFTALANNLKIPEKAYANTLKKFSSRNKEVEELIGHSFLNNAAKEQYLKIWMDKQQIFEDNIR
jgi:serine/threonine-protein kinase HipA